MTLKDALSPWLRTYTWHAQHPLDRQRFHQAVATAFRIRGEMIHAEEFREAMLAVLRNCEPEKNFDEGHWSTLVRNYAQQAEDIGAFLVDTGLLHQLRQVDDDDDDDDDN